MRRLRRDVEATLGAHAAHVDAEIDECAAEIEDLEGFEGADAAQKLVDDVQQYVHDTFISTAWPPCLAHAQHPLEYSDGWWRCPRDGTPAAELGALPLTCANGQ
jgi:hypothetical protein